MSPGAGNAVYPVTLNSDTMPRGVLIAVGSVAARPPQPGLRLLLPDPVGRALRVHGAQTASVVAPVDVVPEIANNDYGGTMFDIIDGLYEEGKINRTQMERSRRWPGSPWDASTKRSRRSESTSCSA